MLGIKRVFDSSILGRSVHVDEFAMGKRRSSLFLLFGGSGIDEEEYARRSESVIPIFDNLLLEWLHLNMTFLYLTAPYDVPLNRFGENPDLAAEWNRHVVDEVLKPLGDVPFFVSGFSGGNLLAFSGVHEHRLCLGGAALGLDGMTVRFRAPLHWDEKLFIYSAPNDRVCNSRRNRGIIDELVRCGQGKEIYLQHGVHRLADYATRDCLGKLFVHADRIAANRSGVGL